MGRYMTQRIMVQSKRALVGEEPCSSSSDGDCNEASLQQCTSTLPSNMCEMLRTMLSLVRAYMVQRLESIAADVLLLEQEAVLGCARLQPQLDRKCILLIRNIKEYMKIMGKRIEVVRKNMSLLGISLDDVWVGHHDINARLLLPAQHCAKLIRSSEGTWRLEKVPQILFWVNEVKFGIQLALSRARGQALVSPSAIRLQTYGSLSDQAHIQNTFISVSPRCPSQKRRSHSLPAPKANAFMSMTEAGRLEFTLGTPGIGQENPHTPSAGVEDIKSVSDPEPARRKRRRRPHRSSGTPPAQSDVKASSSSSQVGFDASSGKVSRTSPGKGELGHRWWASVMDVCPVSHFPVSMLPYPPFKCPAAPPAKGYVMVDGAFVVMKVISTWQFKLLGRTMDQAVIEDLDKYMRRFKLGPFRLSRALELFHLSTHDARQEFTALRRLAARRLARLEFIQAARRPPSLQ
mmetsp:Transcript_66817/g.168730  ORF Transcript_66817/g.168730 Transcript_66817/m.168730 type:complete len:461 (-) Transcript_66817:79-1461(-)